ncbi:MAG: hypothetical protein ACE5JE_05325 [Thermoplasmata archaeon]
MDADGSYPNHPGGFKVLGIIVGVLALVLSLMVLTDPFFGLGLAVALLRLGLIFGGIAAIAARAAGTKMEMPAAPREAI